MDNRIEVERDEFEKWMGKEFIRYELERFPNTDGHMRAGEYRWVEVEVMWRAWQARADRSDGKIWTVV